MNRFTLAIFGGLLVASASAAHADVFSSQSFSGDTSSLNHLPGVNLNAAPGASVNGNCVETNVTGFSNRNSPYGGGTMTECRLGNFSISTMREGPRGPAYNTTYGGNPPPWAQGWRP